jgi:hypothetical protein
MRARSASAEIAVVRDGVSRGVEESRRKWPQGDDKHCRGDSCVARAPYCGAARY